MQTYPEYMPNNYTTEKDLMDRLDSCFCRYNGNPVYIQYRSKDSLYLYRPSDVQKRTPGPIHDINPADPLLDISSIELGYMNYEGKVYYLKRKVTKSPYKQAVHMKNVSISKIDGSSHNIMNTVLYSEAFENMVLGKYPSFEEAFDEPFIENKEVALSKEVAIKAFRSGVKLVYFRGKDVGYIPRGTKTVFVNEGDLKFISERSLRYCGFDVV